MKLTRTVKICYLIGICLTVVGAYYLTFTISLAEWENPDIFKGGRRYEDFSPETQEKLRIMIQPYQNLGLTILLVGAFAFVFVPTLASQIASEVQ